MALTAFTTATSEHIRVYCRIRPVVGVATLVEYRLHNEDRNSGKLEVFVPEPLTARSSHNKASSYKFSFNHIFDQDAEQETVYQIAAKPILDKALLGYNGTVFVYGQTATGKTYTIVGEQANQQQQKKNRRRPKKPKSKQQISTSREKTNPNDLPLNGNNLVENSLPDTTEKTKIPDDLVENPSLHINETNDNLEENRLPDIKEQASPLNFVPDEPSIVENEIASDSIPETYGVVPRTLAYIFSYLSDYVADSQVKVAYYEIYKEHGYDLLSGYSEQKRAAVIDHLTEIKAMTDGRHNLHMRYLSRHLVTNVTQALELLEHGNANRQVAETHLNEASSRSHSIFTIYLTIKQPETESILKPKIHLVDLAGSERIGRYHEKSEKIMAEGKNINLSLHHLQQVIVALSKKKASKHRHHHVPYRNSTMTLVLSDSLGGNSTTAMIATISAEQKNLEESISTCRFAQTVGSISNKIIVNQIEDADLIIAKLRQELEMTK